MPDMRNGTVREDNPHPHGTPHNNKPHISPNIDAMPETTDQLFPTEKITLLLVLFYINVIIFFGLIS